MVFFALDRVFVTRTESSDDNRFGFTYPFFDIDSHVGLGSDTDIEYCFFGTIDTFASNDAVKMDLVIFTPLEI
jgi:hypothetical protein